MEWCGPRQVLWARGRPIDWSVNQGKWYGKSRIHATGRAGPPLFLGAVRAVDPGGYVDVPRLPDMRLVDLASDVFGDEARDFALDARDPAQDLGTDAPGTHLD